MVDINDEGLEKWIWTEADYESMGWHDARVWAFALFPETNEFVLDLDYIVRWIPPQGDETFYTFWTAPATLVFRNVHDLNFDVGFSYFTSLVDLQRSHPGTPKNVDYIDSKIEWLWVLEFLSGEISLRSIGFTQYFRRKPIQAQRQTLSLEERGGLSFERHTPDGVG